MNVTDGVVVTKIRITGTALTTKDAPTEIGKRDDGMRSAEKKSVARKRKHGNDGNMNSIGKPNMSGNVLNVNITNSRNMSNRWTNANPAATDTTETMNSAVVVIAGRSNIQLEARCRTRKSRIDAVFRRTKKDEEVQEYINLKQRRNHEIRSGTDRRRTLHHTDCR
jgi:hypothetical protein